MPRTKPSSQKRRPVPVENGSLAEVLTLSEAAEYLRLTEADVLRLIRDQELPARQVGSEWRFFKTAVQEWLSQPARKHSKDDQLAMAGLWKEDPNLEAMVESIYRERGRPITEDGSYKLFHGLKGEGESE